jgi:hypothetical protein
MDINTVKTYAQKNLVSPKKGRRCVDGRYTKGDYSGMIARPGADGGYVAILHALELAEKHPLTTDELVHKVHDSLNSIGEQFFAHTDHHADHLVHTHNIGCGHLARPTNPDHAEGYSVDPENMKEIVKDIKALAHEGTIHMVTLEGDHKEEGVLVVTDPTMAVDSYDGEHQFFVYDQTRDQDFIKDVLLPGLNLPFTYDEFWEISQQQTSATLQLLAKGLPIYLISSKDDEIIVEEAGVV